VFRIDIGTSGVSALPDRFASKQGFEALARDFPGLTTDPAEIVVSNASSAGVERALAELRTTLAADPRFGDGELERSADGTVAVLSVPVAGDPSASEATNAVRELRSQIVPEAFKGTDAEALVGGQSSEDVDYFDSVIDPAPYVIAFVLLLTFILLTVVFRSIVVAGTAVALNLLSVGAAYGLLVLVFQEGVGAGLLGFQQTDTIEAWVPLFLFSVLFGLSMDYQVFLLSRIRERFDQSGDTTDAVTFGVGSTARIITGAALIIVAVFSGFARGDLIMFQQMGFGVAVALLIDATIIRSFRSKERAQPAVSLHRLRRLCGSNRSSDAAHGDWARSGVSGTGARAGRDLCCAHSGRRGGGRRARGRCDQPVRTACANRSGAHRSGRRAARARSDSSDRLRVDELRLRDRLRRRRGPHLEALTAARDSGPGDLRLGGAGSARSRRGAHCTGRPTLVRRRAERARRRLFPQPGIRRRLILVGQPLAGSTAD
jgi:hypothetical protein